jgi:para-aminobenzoate synthetase / 4-amino-4-deoxychorismate lyase
MQAIQTAATSLNSVLLVTSRRAHESRKSYLFTNPEYTFTLTSLNEFHVLLSELDAAPGRGLYAAGYIGYECGYAIELRLPCPLESSTPLAWFGFYRYPVIFDYVPEPISEIVLPEPSLEISKEEYFSKFAKIKSHIKAGNTYQVNLTTRLKWENNTDVARLFSHLMAVQPVEFGALINIDGIQILSASPELFFRRDGSHIITRPMKGTAPRGFSIDEQRINAAWLANDEKNRAENVMIVDLLRNDLRRICQVSTVKVDELCAVETFPTVLQMVSTISGRLRPTIQYTDIFRALFPCGSITGAPKVRTMQIIRSLENHPRGVYTGSIGFISPHDEAVFNVAIRTLVLQNGKGQMGIGGGITWDSDPLEEFNECRLKGKFLSRSSAPFQLIETILWDNEYKFLSEHLSRLASSAEYFDFSYDSNDIITRLQSLANEFSSPQRVRLLLSKNGAANLSSTPLQVDNQSKITTVISCQRTDSNDLFLRHKTTRRTLYDTEFQSAQSKGYGDVIFTNKDGFITEGAIHNIFIIRDGQWLTPPVSDGLLPGVLREILAKESKVYEKQISIEDLVLADEIYLGNSVRGLRKVSRVDKIEDTAIKIWG